MIGLYIVFEFILYAYVLYVHKVKNGLILLIYNKDQLNYPLNMFMFIRPLMMTTTPAEIIVHVMHWTSSMYANPTVKLIMRLKNYLCDLSGSIQKKKRGGPNSYKNRTLQTKSIIYPNTPQANCFKTNETSSLSTAGLLQWTRLSLKTPLWPIIVTNRESQNRPQYTVLH